MLLGVFVAFLCQAQVQGLDALHSGRIVLANGDTLDGTFSINLGNDLVQYKQGNAIKTYSARQIEYFLVQEPALKTIRYFFTLPYSDHGNYKAPHLFELLYLGPVLSVYLRERLVTENVPYYDAFTNRTYYTTRTRLVTDFYFRDNKGKLQEFEGKQKDFLRLMKPHEKEMKQFLKDNDISLEKREDVVKAIDYYNNLVQPQPNGTKNGTSPDTSKQR